MIHNSSFIRYFIFFGNNNQKNRFPYEAKWKLWLNVLADNLLFDEGLFRIDYVLVYLCDRIDYFERGFIYVFKYVFGGVKSIFVLILSFLVFISVVYSLFFIECCNNNIFCSISIWMFASSVLETLYYNFLSINLI
jgi:hypothetical protein